MIRCGFGFQHTLWYIILSAVAVAAGDAALLRIRGARRAARVDFDGGSSSSSSCAFIDHGGRLLGSLHATATLQGGGCRLCPQRMQALSCAAVAEVPVGVQKQRRGQRFAAVSALCSKIAALSVWNKLAKLESQQNSRSTWQSLIRCCLAGK